MEEWLQIVAQVGFPIAMCLWFMFRTEKIINLNTEALNRLTDMVDRLCTQNGRRKN